jgi:hypothetical protein
VRQVPCQTCVHEAHRPPCPVLDLVTCAYFGPYLSRGFVGAAVDVVAVRCFCFGPASDLLRTCFGPASDRLLKTAATLLPHKQTNKKEQPNAPKDGRRISKGGADDFQRKMDDSQRKRLADLDAEGGSDDGEDIGDSDTNETVDDSFGSLVDFIVDDDEDPGEDPRSAQAAAAAGAQAAGDEASMQEAEWDFHEPDTDAHDEEEADDSASMEESEWDFDESDTDTDADIYEDGPVLSPAEAAAVAANAAAQVAYEATFDANEPARGGLLTKEAVQAAAQAAYRATSGANGPARGGAESEAALLSAMGFMNGAAAGDAGAGAGAGANAGAASASVSASTPLETGDGGWPSAFVCPITQTVMQTPVMCSRGHSFERDAIYRWLQDHATHPLTREPICAAELRLNRALLLAIGQLDALFGQ